MSEERVILSERPEDLQKAVEWSFEKALGTIWVQYL